MLKIMTNQIQVNTALATPVMLADTKQKVFLRVGLTGFDLTTEKVAPLNVALVIDKSGSMQGEKINQAKRAALLAVEQLRPDDIIAIVTYDHHAEILLPATKVQNNKLMIKVAINKLTAGGQSALYHGIETGAKEIRKFLAQNRINRMILVSDGLANVGPSTPEELGALSASLNQENIAITTIGLGLGYHEDLMVLISKKSDGNHFFVENASDLRLFFRSEFSDILSVVAQEVNVAILGINGTNLVRVLGREANIQDNQIYVKLNQLYSEQEKYVLAELEVPPTKVTQKSTLAGVAVVYRNMDNGTNERMSQIITAAFTDSPQLVEENTNSLVATAAIEQLAIEKNKLAVKLRDDEQIIEAQQMLLDNATFLAEKAAQYASPNLEILKKINLNDAQNLDTQNWTKQRKSMRHHQHKWEIQQKY